MNSLKAWLAGARPKTLPAAIAPVVVASAYAGERISIVKALAALLVGVALQIAVNYANDYSDGIRGTDRDRVGPMRLVGSGVKRASSVKRAAYLFFFIAMIAGSYLAITTSYWLFAIGAIAIVAAWKYTGGERPYGYRGLGEISVFIFFGLVATMGTYYVQTREIDFGVTVIGSAMGSIACGILLLNNIRDIETDKVAGKRTLSVRIGMSASLILYWLLIFLAILVFIAMTGFPWLSLILLSTPLVVKLRSAVRTRAWLSALEATGRFQLLYATLLSLALVLSVR